MMSTNSCGIVSEEAMIEITKETPVPVRIKHLKDLLAKWEQEGVPAGVVVPKSPRRAKAWEMPEYHVFPIGSPRDWNSKHEVWGGDVKEIGAIIKRLLNKKPGRHHWEPERLRRIRTQTKLTDSEETLKKVAAQWHEAQERAEIAETRHRQLLKKLELAEADRSAALDENAELIRLMSSETKKLQVVS
ncbi:hypothetical protein [Rhizobium leguminosarum]|uniref:hypothetical protein n=1 Tax=Rhizobium leguminosarum TaxID=384 RepID=UPI001C9560AC|nr:hypothetical protein [Rhizobium leguminosarum]MBY5431017.1 hypothetical protein [Rhizobium leguminosarum]